MIVQQNENMDKSTYLGLPLLEPLEVIRTRRGKYGGTWVHPYIFLDFAVWLSPVFKMWAMGERSTSFSSRLSSSQSTPPSPV